MDFQNIAEPMKMNEDEYIFLSENLDAFGILDKNKIASFVVLSRKKQIKTLLKKAINEELSETQRDIIIKKWYKGQSLSEIARQLGVSKSTVSRQLNYAYDILRGALKYVLEYQFTFAPDTIDYLKEAEKYEQRH